MSEDRIEGALKKGIGHVQDGFGGLTGDQQTQAKGKLNEGVGSLQNAYGKVVDQAQAAIGEAQDRAQDVYGEVERYVRNQPLMAVGIGAGAGLLIGMLLRGGRKTVYLER